MYFSYSLPTVKPSGYEIDRRELSLLLGSMDENQPTAYACIDSQTLADLLASMDEDHFNKRYLRVDCRFPYEYEAGHISVIYSFFCHLQIINFSTQLIFIRSQQFTHSSFPRTGIYLQKEVLAFRYFIANIRG